MKGQLAPNVNYDVELLDGGKAKLSLVYSQPEGYFDGGFFVNLSAEQVADLAIDSLEKAIPGDQTGMAAAMKAALHLALNKPA